MPSITRTIAQYVLLHMHCKINTCIDFNLNLYMCIYIYSIVFVHSTLKQRPPTNTCLSSAVKEHGILPCYDIVGMSQATNHCLICRE